MCHYLCIFVCTYVYYNYYHTFIWAHDKECIPDNAEGIWRLWVTDLFRLIPFRNIKLLWSNSSGPTTAPSFVTESTLSVAMATANGEVDSGARSQAEVARVHEKNMLCEMGGGNAWELCIFGRYLTLRWKASPCSNKGSRSVLLCILTTRKYYLSIA
jgi:hypothetical protein